MGSRPRASLAGALGRARAARRARRCRRSSGCRWRRPSSPPSAGAPSVDLQLRRPRGEHRWHAPRRHRARRRVRLTGPATVTDGGRDPLRHARRAASTVKAPRDPDAAVDRRRARRRHRAAGRRRPRSGRGRPRVRDVDGRRAVRPSRASTADGADRAAAWTAAAVGVGRIWRGRQHARPPRARVAARRRAAGAAPPAPPPAGGHATTCRRDHRVDIRRTRRTVAAVGALESRRSSRRRPRAVPRVRGGPGRSAVAGQCRARRDPADRAARRGGTLSRHADRVGRERCYAVRAVETSADCRSRATRRPRRASPRRHLSARGPGGARRRCHRRARST